MIMKNEELRMNNFLKHKNVFLNERVYGIINPFMFNLVNFKIKQEIKPKIKSPHVGAD